jgi:hypothetical protein
MSVTVDDLLASLGDLLAVIDARADWAMLTGAEKKLRDRAFERYLNGRLEWQGIGKVSLSEAEIRR